MIRRGIIPKQFIGRLNKDGKSLKVFLLLDMLENELVKFFVVATDFRQLEIESFKATSKNAPIIELEILEDDAGYQMIKSVKPIGELNLNALLEAPVADKTAKK